MADRSRSWLSSACEDALARKRGEVAENIPLASSASVLSSDSPLMEEWWELMLCTLPWSNGMLMGDEDLGSFSKSAGCPCGLLRPRRLMKLAVSEGARSPGRVSDSELDVDTADTCRERPGTCLRATAADPSSVVEVSGSGVFCASGCGGEDDALRASTFAAPAA